MRDFEAVQKARSLVLSGEKLTASPRVFKPDHTLLFK